MSQDLVEKLEAMRDRKLSELHCEYAGIAQADARGDRICNKRAARLAELLDELGLTPEDYAGDLEAIRKIPVKEAEAAALEAEIPALQAELDGIQQRINDAYDQWVKLRERQRWLGGVIISRASTAHGIKKEILELTARHSRALRVGVEEVSS